MYLHIALVLLLFNFASTSGDIYAYELVKDIYGDFDSRYPSWPSISNSVSAMRMVKREAEVTQAGHMEGGIADIEVPISAKDKEQLPNDQARMSENIPIPVIKSNGTTAKPNVQKSITNTANESITTLAPITTVPTASIIPSTSVDNDTTTNQLDLNNPGVLKRGLIVFGGFALLAVAYYVFFKRKSNKSDVNNTHNSNETNQFRYGVLQSDDQRDNLELSRVPLTMESDEDDDEDLEIFDLEQKKKSLSYINLQPNDDEFDMPTGYTKNPNNDKDSLLLDIDDTASDTLINWSSNEK